MNEAFMKVDRISRRESSFRLGLSLAVVVVTMAGTSASAQAGLCGDDLQGGRVACACGDIVSSDTQLRAGDPVVSERCSTDGLFLRAPRGASSILLDLNGLSIVGRGIGSGIRVIDGGTNGATILGSSDGRRGQIVAFRNGLHALGKTDLAVMRDVDVLANASDGVVVSSSGAELSGIRAADNGRDGLRLRGHGSRYTDIEAEGNLGNGVRIGGSGAELSGRAAGNGENGIQISGEAHNIHSTASTDNAGKGVFATGRNHRMADLDLRDNAAGDLAGSSAGLKADK
jgi:hypothetical protein